MHFARATNNYFHIKRVQNGTSRYDRGETDNTKSAYTMLYGPRVCHFKNCI